MYLLFTLNFIHMCRIGVTFLAKAFKKGRFLNSNLCIRIVLTKVVKGKANKMESNIIQNIWFQKSFKIK